MYGLLKSIDLDRIAFGGILGFPTVLHFFDSAS